MSKNHIDTKHLVMFLRNTIAKVDSEYLFCYLHVEDVLVNSVVDYITNPTEENFLPYLYSRIQDTLNTIEKDIRCVMEKYIDMGYTFVGKQVSIVNAYKNGTVPLYQFLNGKKISDEIKSKYKHKLKKGSYNNTAIEKSWEKFTTDIQQRIFSGLEERGTTKEQIIQNNSYHYQQYFYDKVSELFVDNFNLSLNDMKEKHAICKDELLFYIIDKLIEQSRMILKEKITFFFRFTKDVNHLNKLKITNPKILDYLLETSNPWMFVCEEDGVDIDSIKKYYSSWFDPEFKFYDLLGSSKESIEFVQSDEILDIGFLPNELGNQGRFYDFSNVYSEVLKMAGKK